ncbi:murein L,D-transpeptidase [Camelimonas abortus]|uniref:Murein L,D-transpeptidase n=1 Tax=Camelimonas abortus TaxID=1017184 RepID=A0ABV7LBQ5_9HYPH
MKRRTFLLGAGGVVAGLVAGPALAQQFAFQNQAEWSQSYDAGVGVRSVRSSTPLLSRETLAATEEAIARLREIEARGGWGSTPAGQRLRLGARGPAVVALRQRLAASGDLPRVAGAQDIFDSYVEGGVKRFQLRHGLNPTGALNAQTIAAMNVPVSTRIRQLETNLVRLRALSANPGRRYAVVNIPAALVETVRDGHVVSRHAAGVGKIDRQSPIMNARVTQINFNPFWTVPASIIRKDLIPRMRKDPNYLTDQKIRIYYNGVEIPPSQVDWNSYEATRYTFRQDPGADINSMGFVRINIPNPHGVYMHDTPARGIFGDDYRFVSSGCVRVQNIRDYVAFLLEETPGWDARAIQAAIDSGKRIDVNLAQPVPIYWTYITAWGTPEGVIQFRDDIYNRDGLGVNASMAAAAAEEQAGESH